MYAPLLANRYLTSRIIPFIAVAAVALCVALVIVVVSVMTGFLDMVRSSGKTLIGDVVVTRDISGIPYYLDFIAEIEALPEAEAASAIVETYGLLQMPYGNGDSNRIETVQVWGIDPVSLDRVASFYDKLYWVKPSEELAKTLAPDDPRLDPEYQRDEEGRTLRTSDGRPGIALGIEISAFNERSRDGSYRCEGPSNMQDPGYFMPNTRGAVLTLVPVSESASLAGEKKRRFAIVNEFQSGVYQIDAQRVLAPLADVQEMLLLNAAPLTSRTELDANGRPKVIGESPARATTIVVKASDGVSALALKIAVDAAYARFAARIDADDTKLVKAPEMITVATWEERLADLIGPVEKERELMRTLFSIVYLVCAGLVLAIFWAIVQEKTRDIGILRAIGASRTGVLWIFLRYGLLIGVAGSLVGVLLAWCVVTRINDIHDFLGAPAAMWLKVTASGAAITAIAMALRGLLRNSALETVLWTFASIALVLISVVLFLHHGFMVWDPSVYYFSRIPNSLDWMTASTTVIGGVIFSVVGASIPAARAADTDPVKSLRYE